MRPYVAATRMIVPAWGVLGYANLGANFFEHTSLPSRFGPNQLHANSLALALGSRVMWGPNGRQVNTNGGVRVHFWMDSAHRADRDAKAMTRFPL